MSFRETTPLLSDGDLSSWTPRDGNPEVICVGLMRTGLQSLHRAFSILGYTNIYDQERISHSYELWNDVLQNRDPTLAFQTMFRNSQIVMGMPTFCFWEDILKLYPNAKVILTVRDEDGWWRSVSKAWHSRCELVCLKWLAVVIPRSGSLG